MSASSLKLIGSKLSDHVGHTVEVTGTIAAKADKRRRIRRRVQRQPLQPSLNVSNIKMIAATCQVSSRSDRTLLHLCQPDTVSGWLFVSSLAIVCW